MHLIKQLVWSSRTTLTLSQWSQNNSHKPVVSRTLSQASGHKTTLTSQWSQEHSHKPVVTRQRSQASGLKNTLTSQWSQDNSHKPVVSRPLPQASGWPFSRRLGWVNLMRELLSVWVGTGSSHMRGPARVVCRGLCGHGGVHRGEPWVGAPSFHRWRRREVCFLEQAYASTRCTDLG